MSRRFEGHVAIVTAAGSGIGAATAKRLAAEGARLVVADLSGTRAQATAQAIAAAGSDAAWLKMDAAEPPAVEATVALALSRWGRLDVLVNNASSFYPTPIGTIDETHWDDLVGSNLKAPLFLSQAAAPLLATQQGAIVNIADIHADRPLKGYPLYCAAKAGLVMLTKALARELAPAVRVNAVAPGAILWPEHASEETRRAIIARTALKRQGRPRDIARAVSFLVMDADYVTGQVLTVDGGRSLSG